MPGDFTRRGIKIPRTETETEAAAAVYEQLATGARKVAAGFDSPDDDWRPIWIVATKTQGTLMTPDKIASDRDKVAMTRAVAAFARKVGAVAIGHLHSTWMVGAEWIDQKRLDEITAWMNAGGQLASGEIPEAREALMINVITASSAHGHIAPIHRHPDGPPGLGEFDGRQIDIAGRMANPLRDALRRVG